MATTKKITQLPAAASVAGTDLLPVVHDPGGTPETQKATVDQVRYADAITPIADGTYTVGLKLTGGGNNGTITTKGGFITAIQQAT